MDVTSSYRPRVSGETRLLLTTALVAAAALWILARIRFPDLPPSPNPVAPLLSQLAAPRSFDMLASEVVRVQGGLQSSLIALDASVHGSTSADVSTVRVAGLRFRDDLAVAVLPSERPREVERLRGAIASDPASGLFVVRVPVELSVPFVSQRASPRFDRPQYLMMTVVSAERVTLRPVFVTSLEQQANALWPEPLWVIPPHSEMAVGAFLFTTAGELVGAVIAYRSAACDRVVGDTLGRSRSSRQAADCTSGRHRRRCTVPVPFAIHGNGCQGWRGCDVGGSEWTCGRRAGDR